MSERDDGKTPAESGEALRQELKEDQQEMQQVNAFTVLGSVFRAWFGVQTEENRRRDFASNNPTPFIVAGIIFVLVMIAGVILAVNLAMAGAS